MAFPGALPTIGLNDCVGFDDSVYFAFFMLGAIGWALCFAISLSLLITYWALHKSRVKAEDELIKYKFSEQREVFKVPHDSNPRINQAGTSHSQPMTPSVMSEIPDPFLNSQRTTYRPPTGIPMDAKQRWQPTQK